MRDRLHVPHYGTMPKINIWPIQRCCGSRPFDTDPDPAFHLDTDPDPAFHFDTDPDPTV